MEHMLNNIFSALVLINIVFKTSGQKMFELFEIRMFELSHYILAVASLIGSRFCTSIVKIAKEIIDFF